jgi:hypothetical protein
LKRDARLMNDQIRPKVYAAAFSFVFAVQEHDEAVRTLNVQIDVSSFKGQHDLRASSFPICPAPRGKDAAPGASGKHTGVPDVASRYYGLSPKPALPNLRTAQFSSRDSALRGNSERNRNRQQAESRESKLRFAPRISHTEVEDPRQSVHSSRPWPLDELKRLIVR